MYEPIVEDVMVARGRGFHGECRAVRTGIESFVCFVIMLPVSRKLVLL